VRDACDKGLERQLIRLIGTWDARPCVCECGRFFAKQPCAGLCADVKSERGIPAATDSRIMLATSGQMMTFAKVKDERER